MDIPACLLAGREAMVCAREEVRREARRDDGEDNLVSQVGEQDLVDMEGQRGEAQRVCDGLDGADERGGCCEERVLHLGQAACAVVCELR